MIKKLKPRAGNIKRNQEMIRMHNEGMSFREIAKLYGISAERVRQIYINDEVYRKYQARLENMEKKAEPKE